jgi:hypothetical protein
MKKVYILSGSQGTCDTAYDFTIGVYSTEELAIEAKNKFIDEIITMSMKYSSEEIEKLYQELALYWYNCGEYKDDEYDKLKIAMPKHLSEFDDWPLPFKHHDERYHTDKVEIKEVEMDTRIFEIH